MILLVPHLLAKALDEKLNYTQHSISHWKSRAIDLPNLPRQSTYKL